MTCEHCQELISVFLDNELDEPSASEIRIHLAECASCSKVCEDLAMILDFCHPETDGEAVPPNSQALWCRINNLIENETVSEPKEPDNPPGWFPQRWNLSLPQMVSAVLAIALLSSLLTFLGVNALSSPDTVYAAASVSESTVFEKLLGRLGLMETPQKVREKRIKARDSAIDYWNKRVEARRAQWDGHFRDAFDRNLNEIDQVVNEYSQILEEDPQDELSSEMLDSALNEKMELLRTFSEL
jgi:hypothetical protein